MIKTNPQTEAGLSNNSKFVPQKGITNNKAAQSKEILKPNEASEISNFNLEKATSAAYEKAKDYMNEVLYFDGMAVDMVNKGKKTVGVVTDFTTGKVVNEYSGLDLLKLYATNNQKNGIILDGSI